MNELFAYAPEACTNTIKIASMIDVDIPHGSPLLPTYKLNQKEKTLQERYLHVYPQDIHHLSDQEWLLRFTCFQGLNRRYNFSLSEQDIFACVHKEIQ